MATTTMTAADIRTLSRVLLAEFRRAYCHANNRSTRLVRDGVTLNPYDCHPLDAVRYMADTYRRTPSLWPVFVRRARRAALDGSAAADLLDRLTDAPCPFT